MSSCINLKTKPNESKNKNAYKVEFNIINKMKGKTDVKLLY